MKTEIKFITKKGLGIGLTTLLALMTGCTMIPKYSQPDAPVPAEWTENHASSESGLKVEETGWRDLLTDPKLQKVIEVTLENNRDLRIAALNVERAKTLYGIQRSELLPVVNATGAGGKQRAAADLTVPGYPRTTEAYSVNLGVTSWEIDLFGRVRSLKEVALQEYLASEEVQRGALLSLISGTASAYYALAADIEQLKLAESTYEAQKSAYDLIR
ncbi:MAG: TolC family protein, partial [Lentisphaerae bacterium]|nr:TolC family protein [Lentisphaerota bacterium]